MKFFAYGSLEFPDVMEAVTGRRFAGCEAVLEGFARELLAERPYPGLAPRPGARTTGVLYDGLDVRAFELLDLFEDDFYARRALDVSGDDGRVVRAEVYVVEETHVSLLTGAPWSRTRFAARHLPGFLEGCRSFHVQALEEIARRGRSHPT